MPHSAQARKRVRQSEKRRIRNKSLRSEIKTLTGSLNDKVSAKDMEAARALFQRVVSKIDKAAKNHIVHRNTAARQKSKLARLLNSIASGAASKNKLENTGG